MTYIITRSFPSPSLSHRCDIAVSDLYATLPFDNKPGEGGWTQGFKVSYDEEEVLKPENREGGGANSKRTFRDFYSI